ncbi:hypothetical protein TNCV_1945471 [Trichonephila clavipes]|nr:hypothetical protein TNCV_1945471 [Trichonephila clavipes]
MSDIIAKGTNHRLGNIHGTIRARMPCRSRRSFLQGRPATSKLRSVWGPAPVWQPAFTTDSAITRRIVDALYALSWPSYVLILGYNLPRQISFSGFELFFCCFRWHRYRKRVRGSCFGYIGYLRCQHEQIHWRECTISAQ